jgi:ferric-dicitrate binding protein FerR (iron transport regulator)
MALRPRLLGWRPALAGVAILLLLAVIGWVLTPRVSQWATLIVENGEAQVAWQRPLYFRWSRSGVTSVPGGSEFYLAEGDRVALSEDGNGNVVFQDGGQLRLAGDTVLTLEEIDPARRVTRIKVETGEVEADIPSLPGPLVFEVNTPAATIRALSTIFRARVVAADHTYSATDEGVTRVTLLDAALGYPSVDVPAGYEVDAVIGHAIGLRQPRPASAV